MQNGPKYRNELQVLELPGVTTGIVSQGLWSEPPDVSGVDWSAGWQPGGHGVDEKDWPAYAIGLLYTNRETVKSLTALHRLMRERGYTGGRTALYSMAPLCAAAKALGIYTPNTKVSRPRRGHRSADGSVEAVDDHE